MAQEMAQDIDFGRLLGDDRYREERFADAVRDDAVVYAIYRNAGPDSPAMLKAMVVSLLAQKRTLIKQLEQAESLRPIVYHTHDKTLVQYPASAISP